LSVFEWQSRSVTLDHRNIRATHPSLERIGQGRINFKRSDALKSRAQEIGGQARAGTDLQQILPQINVLERPRQHFYLKKLLPETGPTHPPV
jgi:hypothetical protein